MINKKLRGFQDRYTLVYTLVVLFLGILLALSSGTLSSQLAFASPGDVIPCSFSDSYGWAKGDSFYSAISADGRYVAFDTLSNNLGGVEDNNNAWDVVRKDMVTGEVVYCSVTSKGEVGDGDSRRPSISWDGRYVAFETIADNLYPGSVSGVWEVLVKDMLTGAITRASASASGEAPNGDCVYPSINGDGRYVAFQSGATNLHPDDRDGITDILRKDMRSGAVELCSISSTGEKGNGNSHDPAISEDGSMVAFWSSSDNLVEGDTNRTDDVFRRTINHDLNDIAAVNSSYAFAVGDNGTILATTDGGAHWISQESKVSVDLNAIYAVNAYWAWAVGDGGTILITTDGGANWTPQVSGVTHNLRGVAAANSSYAFAVGDEGTILGTTDGGAHWNLLTSTGTAEDLYSVHAVNAYWAWAVGSNGTIVRTTNGTGWNPQISGTTHNLRGVTAANSSYAFAVGDGIILYTTDGGANWNPATFTGVSADFYSAACVNAYWAWAVGTDGTIMRTTDGVSWNPQNSGTSRLLRGVAAVNSSYAWAVGDDGTILATSDGGAHWNPQGSKASETVRCSTSSTGVEGNGTSQNLSMSSDGRYVVFNSYASNLVPGDRNNQCDVFRKDVETGEMTLVSTSSEGVQGNLKSHLPNISDDGRYVSFSSYASNLVPNDFNGALDVFRKDLATGTLVRASVSASGAEGNGISDISCMSRDALFIAFESKATNLVDDPPLSSINVYRKELALTPELRSPFYFPEGYTGTDFQTYLVLLNVNPDPAYVSVEYRFTDGSFIVKNYNLPAQNRITINVNSEVGAGAQFSMVVKADIDNLAPERSMYFNYQGKWTGGHVVFGSKTPSSTLYFAEGYTGDFFDEYLCVYNPGDVAANLTFNFQTQEAGLIVKYGSVGPHTRATFFVNEMLQGKYQHSTKLDSTQPVVAERPMYFDYLGRGAMHWEGGHCVMGVPYISNIYYFAEGTTRMGWTTGFQEWLTLQNPHDHSITIEAVYQLGPGQGGPVYKSYNLGAGRRYSVFVINEVGYNKDVSVRLTSSEEFFAERPMYFNYYHLNTYWQGGHCVIGATAQSSELLFAEGCTYANFHEWLCLQNTHETLSAEVELTFYAQELTNPIVKNVTVPANTRTTLFINTFVGSNYNLGCRVRVISGPNVMAERPMYFKYGGVWDGGHDVVGYVPLVPN